MCKPKNYVSASIVTLRHNTSKPTKPLKEPILLQLFVEPDQITVVQATNCPWFFKDCDSVNAEGFTPWLTFKLSVDVGDNEIQFCIYALVIIEDVYVDD